MLRLGPKKAVIENNFIGADETDEPWSLSHKQTDEYYEYRAYLDGLGREPTLEEIYHMVSLYRM